MSGGEFGTPGDGRGVELAREYLATHGPDAPHVNRLLEMDRDAVMEAAAERVCGPVGCPPGSVFDGREDSLADAVHQAVGAALEKLGQLGYPVTFGPVPGSVPADLPATLASVDDVRRVCEAAGLTEWQSHPASKLTMRWGTAEHAIVGMHYDRNQVLVWQPGIALVPVTVPLQWPATALYAAIQAARSTS